MRFSSHSDKNILHLPGMYYETRVCGVCKTSLKEKRSETLRKGSRCSRQNKKPNYKHLSFITILNTPRWCGMRTLNFNESENYFIMLMVEHFFFSYFLYIISWLIFTFFLMTWHLLLFKLGLYQQREMERGGIYHNNSGRNNFYLKYHDVLERREFLLGLTPDLI